MNQKRCVLLQRGLCARIAEFVDSAVHGALMVGMTGIAIANRAKLCLHLGYGQGMATGAHVNAGRFGKGNGTSAVGQAVAGLAADKDDAVFAFIPFLGNASCCLGMAAVAVAIHGTGIEVFGSRAADNGKSPGHVEEIPGNENGDRNQDSEDPFECHSLFSLSLSAND